MQAQGRGEMASATHHFVQNRVKKSCLSHWDVSETGKRSLLMPINTYFQAWGAR